MRKNDGSVLPIILVMTLIMAWVCGDLLSSIRQSYQLAGKEWQHSQSKIKALLILKTLHISQKSNCYIARLQPGVIQRQPRSWWEMVGCHNHELKTDYDYAIEPFGQDACAKVGPSYQQNIAGYARVTLYYREGDTNLMLQSMFTYPIVSDEKCEGQKRYIHLGLQAAHEL